MSEASRSMIDEMMGYLGETATPLVGDQMRGMAIRTGSGPKEVNLMAPPVVADRAVGNEFRPPTVIGVWG